MFVCMSKYRKIMFKWLIIWKKSYSVCYAYHYSWLIFMALIKQNDLIYSFKQYCECEIIMLTENVIFFVWNWGVKRTKVWICVKTYLLTTTPSPININLSNYEKEFNMFWDRYLKLYVWGNGTVGILHSMFWGSIGTLWWKPTVHTFKTNIGE